MSSAVRDLGHDVPHIVDQVRHTGLGRFLNSGSNSIDSLKAHAGEITRGVGKASGGVAHVGVSAIGAITLAFSVVFLTLFGLVDEPKVRDWIGGLLYRDDRERFLQLSDEIVEGEARP